LSVIKSILLLYGGVSGEHEVSCVSAKNIESLLQQSNFSVISIYIDREGFWHLQKSVQENPVDNIDNICFLENNYINNQNNKIKFDVAFSIIHGTFGEDGSLQGLFELIQVPYTGSGVMTSSVCMDKYIFKKVLETEDINQVNYCRVIKSNFQLNEKKEIDQITSQIDLPMFIKPCNMGSSVGVYKVNAREDISTFLKKAFQYDDVIICEKAGNYRELECSILGNFPNYEVSQIGEIISHHEFYSYEAKYEDKNGADLILPANIDNQLIKQIHEIAIKSFQAVNGDGFARIDFFLDKDTNQLILNEINTLPGFTSISMFSKLWEISGKSSVELIKDIVLLAEKKHFNKQLLKRTK